MSNLRMMHEIENQQGQLLKDKVVLIYGATGAVGSTVAQAFAREGAQVFLSGRRSDPVERVAGEIRASDGKAQVEVVDALNDKAVNAYIDRVAEQEGGIDIVFNAVGPPAIEYGNGTSTIKLSYKKFMIPMNTVVASNFLTARVVVV
jgi:NADP-dependent 3-hydroxy acid dehydrogenase YdfG